MGIHLVPITPSQSQCRVSLSSTKKSRVTTVSRLVYSCLVVCTFAPPPLRDRLLLRNFVGLELLILLHQPLECCWDYEHAPPHLPIVCDFMYQAQKENSLRSSPTHKGIPTTYSLIEALLRGAGCLSWLWEMQSFLLIRRR